MWTIRSFSFTKSKGDCNLIKLGNLIKNPLTLILNLNQIWSLLLLIAQFHAHQAMFFLVFYRSPHLKRRESYLLTQNLEESHQHVVVQPMKYWFYRRLPLKKKFEDKESEKKQKWIEKENRKKLRAIKKLNETEGKSENLAKKKGRKKQKQRRKRKQIFCNYCHGYYYDDESDDEY